MSVLLVLGISDESIEVRTRLSFLCQCRGNQALTALFRNGYGSLPWQVQCYLDLPHADCMYFIQNQLLSVFGLKNASRRGYAQNVAILSIWTCMNSSTTK